VGYEALHGVPLDKDGGWSGTPGLDYREHELSEVGWVGIPNAGRVDPLARTRRSALVPM